MWNRKKVKLPWKVHSIFWKSGFFTDLKGKKFSFKGKELEESPLILCNFKGLDHIYIPRTGLIPVAGPFKDDL